MIHDCCWRKPNKNKNQFISIFSELWEITPFKIVNTCKTVHDIPVLTLN